MAQCTAPRQGHRTASGRAKCPACGSNTYSSYRPLPTKPTNIPNLHPAPVVNKNKRPASEERTKPSTNKTSKTTQLVQWLIEHPTHLEQMEWIADQIGETSETLLKEYGPKYQRLAHHLWCDVLAALAATLEETLKTTDRLIDKTADAFADQVCNFVLSGRANKARNIPGSQTAAQRVIALILPGQKQLDEVILKEATKSFTKKTFQQIILKPRAEIKALLFQVRVLALMLCPAPEIHHAVWNNCAVPLVGDRIVSESLEEIDELKQLLEQRGKSVFSNL